MQQDKTNLDIVLLVFINIVKGRKFMGISVSSSTIKANSLFMHRLRIPEYQRQYSWTTDKKENIAQVRALWTDLDSARHDPPYFLGSLVLRMTDKAHQIVEIVDGQQRLVSLSLMANALKTVAAEAEETLYVKKINSDILYENVIPDHQTSPKLEFTNESDKTTYAELLENPVLDRASRYGNARMVEAQSFFLNKFRKAMQEHRADTIIFLSSWLNILTEGIQFTVFMHPNNEDAFKVFEIINTRGLNLTPAQMIKSYVLGTVESNQKSTITQRWNQMELDFSDINQEDQLTNFIRHVVSLQNGYVSPTDLYSLIKSKYDSSKLVIELLDELEKAKEHYLTLLNPDVAQAKNDKKIASASILSTLRITTVRSLFLAVFEIEDSDLQNKMLDFLIRWVVTRISSGPFGTGSVEKTVSDTARQVHLHPSLQTLSDNLNPLQRTKDEFKSSLTQSKYRNGVLLVLRTSLAQKTVFPILNGYLHSIRPKRTTEWDGFDNEQFALLDGTLANSILLEQKQRPTSTTSWKGVQDNFMRFLYPGEDSSFINESSWDSKAASRFRKRSASQLACLWFSTEL